MGRRSAEKGAAPAGVGDRGLNNAGTLARAGGIGHMGAASGAARAASRRAAAVEGARCSRAGIARERLI